MNGFLYARSKILIVFIPLIILQAGLVLEDFTFRINYSMLILIILPLFFITQPYLVCIDLFVSLTILYFYKHHQQIVFIYLLIPLLVVYFNNPTTSFISTKQYQNYSNKEAETLIQRNKINTLVNLNQSKQNMNQTYQNQITRISGYTSTNHKLYNSYLYDTLKLPISINNRVAQIDQNHLFYLKLMSVDSIVSKKKIEGYQKVDEINGLKLYQSQDVKPIAYATNQLYSQNQFQKLEYPYTLDTLYHQAIVKDGNNDYQSQFIKEDMGLKKEYQIKNNKKTVKLNIKPAEYGEKIKLALYYKGKKIGKDSCDYNDEVWYSNRVTEGMTQKQVRYTWGAPSSTSSSSYGFTYWNWDDGSMVSFRNGVVDYWFDAAN